MIIDEMTDMNTFITCIKRRMKKGEIPIIAEIKKFSPSHGNLLRGRNIEDIAEAYVNAGASCISVVTGKWYHGTPSMLEKIVEKVEIPILQKDFITSKHQLTMSKKLGASAVLLTKKLLFKKHLEDLVHYCLTIDLVPFVEVSNTSELEGLRLPSNTVVAMNNRDITIKETDSTSIFNGINVLPALKECGASLCVSASGIRFPEESRLLFQAGFDAFLIGTALMQSDNIQKTITEFSVL